MVYTTCRISSTLAVPRAATQERFGRFDRFSFALSMHPTIPCQLTMPKKKTRGRLNVDHYLFNPKRGNPTSLGFVPTCLCWQYNEGLSSLGCQILSLEFSWQLTTYSISLPTQLNCYNTPTHTHKYIHHLRLIRDWSLMGKHFTTEKTQCDGQCWSMTMSITYVNNSLAMHWHWKWWWFSLNHHYPVLSPAQGDQWSVLSFWWRSMWAANMKLKRLRRGLWSRCWEWSCLLTFNLWF